MQRACQAMRLSSGRETRPLMQAQDRAQASRAVPVVVVDTRQWRGRGMYYDALALTINLLSGIACAVDIYAAGYLRAATGVVTGLPSFVALARIGLEAAIFAGSFAWVAARLLRASYRELPRLP